MRQFPCMAMDRFAALAMIESGDCDVCTGRDGEVSRFQITTALWHQYSRLPLSAARNPFTALNVAKEIMARRQTRLLAIQHSAISPQEFYLLWSRPARLLSKRFFTLSRAEWDRAQRFANLVNHHE